MHALRGELGRGRGRGSAERGWDLTGFGQCDGETDRGIELSTAVRIDAAGDRATWFDRDHPLKASNFEGLSPRCGSAESKQGDEWRVFRVSNFDCFNSGVQTFTFSSK